MPRHETPAGPQDVLPTLSPFWLHHASCGVDEALEVSTGDKRMAWTQLSDSEGSHSADSVLYGTVEAAKRKSSNPAKWCWDQLGGQENLARVFQQKIATEVSTTGGHI